MKERHKVFADRWAVHHNGTQAVYEACKAIGEKGPASLNSAGVQANRWLKRPDVQARIKEVMKTLEDINEAKKEKELRTANAQSESSKAGAVADVTEALSVLTLQMRGERPWRMRKTKTTVAGAHPQTVETQTAVMEPGLAAARLLDHFDGVGTPPDMGQSGAIRAQVLIVLQDKDRRREFDEIARAVIPTTAKVVPAAGNGNGNGRVGK